MTVAGIVANYPIRLPAVPRWASKTMGIVGNLIKDETVKPFQELREWATRRGAINPPDLQLLTFEAQGVFSDAQNVVGALVEKIPVISNAMGVQSHFGDSFHLSQSLASNAFPYALSDTASYGAVMAVPLVGYLEKAISLFSELRADGHLSSMQAMKMLSTNLFKI